MKVQLRRVNNSYYLLLKREFRELLDITDTVELNIKNNKIIVCKPNDKSTDKVADKVENF